MSAWQLISLLVSVITVVIAVVAVIVVVLLYIHNNKCDILYCVHNLSATTTAGTTLSMIILNIVQQK